jgi:hypothetical protein
MLFVCIQHRWRHMSNTFSQRIECCLRSVIPLSSIVACSNKLEGILEALFSFTDNDVVRLTNLLWWNIRAFDLVKDSEIQDQGRVLLLSQG